MADSSQGPGAGSTSTWLSRAVDWLTNRFWLGRAIVWVGRQVAGPWWGIRDALRVLWACRAPLLSVVIGGALIALTDQARDIVISSAAAKAGFWNKFGLVCTMLAWASVSWYWARVTLNFSFALPPLVGTKDRVGDSASWRKPVAWTIATLAIMSAVVAIWVEGRTLIVIALATVTVVIAFWFGHGVHIDRPKRWREWWRNQAPRMIGSAAIVAVAVAFWNARNVYRDAHDSDAAGFGFWAGGFAVLAIAFYGVVAFRTEIVTWIIGRLPAWMGGRGVAGDGKVSRYFIPRPGVTHERLRDYANPVAVGFLGFSLVLSPALFLWFAADPVGAADFFGGAVRAILFGLATLVPMLSVLVLLSARTGLPLFGAMIAWMVLSGSLTEDNHDVRTLEMGKLAERPHVGDVFVEWWQANAVLQDDKGVRLTQPIAPELIVPPMVIVATAGGASRAAYWTSQVLGEIATREKHFSERVFLVSGVSGGSLGAVAFRSQVAAHRVSGGGDLMDQKTPERARRFLTQDFLTPAMATGLYVDLPLHAFPLGWLFEDRAAALEKAWEASWKAEIQDKGHARFSWDAGFVAMFGGKTDGRAYPILMLNGTSVEKGKRIITSNVRLHHPDATSQNLSGRINRYDAFDILGKDIRISTAVTMSARFPVISPSGGMRRATDRQIETRVTDGGLYENFGAATADEVLRYVVERRRDTQPDPDRKGRTERPVWPLVILISSDPSLDPLDKVTGTGRLAVADCAAVDGNRTPTPVAQPGNAWEECPTDGSKRALTLIDPLFSLYTGRTARGEGAATALFHRVTENRVTMHDRIMQNIRVSDNLKDQDKDVAKEDATARLATYGLVEDFFHFRQCRVANSKGPTMSWHDSDAAWRVMKSMLGLETNDPDPCGNRAEFFRLCVRLAVLSGGSRQADSTDRTIEQVATDACARRWPKPANWECKPHEGRTVCGLWPDKVAPVASRPAIPVTGAKPPPATK